MIGLICIRIYRWYLERKTNPDEDETHYTDNRIRNMQNQINGEIDGNSKRLDWQEKAINELLIEAEIAKPVNQINVPDGTSFEELIELIDPWKAQGYIVSGSNGAIRIYELPLELKK